MSGSGHIAECLKCISRPNSVDDPQESNTLKEIFILRGEKEVQSRRDNWSARHTTIKSNSLYGRLHWSKAYMQKMIAIMGSIL